MKTPTLMLIAGLALVTTSFAVDPPPDGGYPGSNTAEGEDALFSVTTATQNTAVGYHALNASTDLGDNTAVGARALENCTSAQNTAVGSQALLANNSALNVAVGYSAMLSNSTGAFNTACGSEALRNNTTGFSNCAFGMDAANNVNGDNNTAVGAGALNGNTIGSNNIALGYNAGLRSINGSSNIYIGNAGRADDSFLIRIGAKQTNTYIAGISGVTVAGGVGVMVDSKGHLGTVTSSARYKEAIRPMKDASEAVLSLKPVTFRYKKDLDPDSIPQFGLVAEDVAKVDPDLVAKDGEGKPYTVRYEAVNAMLLNEFLKEHKRAEEQAKTVRQQGKMMEAQATEIAELKSALEEVTGRLDAKGL